MLLWILCLACLAFEAQAGLPPDPTAQCLIIHRFEGPCGNLDADTCVRYRQGFDYWNNPEHKHAWDDFSALCGQTRHSHDCIAFLEIGGTCHSTVEAPPEPVEIFQQPVTAMHVQEPVQRAQIYETTLTVGEYRQAEPVAEVYVLPLGSNRPELRSPIPFGVEVPAFPMDHPEIPATPTNPTSPSRDNESTPREDGDLGDSAEVLFPRLGAPEVPANDEGMRGIGSPTNFAMSGSGCTIQPGNNATDSAIWIGLGILFAAMSLNFGRRIGP